jgi:hypothetical protein
LILSCAVENPAVPSTLQVFAAPGALRVVR